MVFGPFLKHKYEFPNYFNDPKVFDSLVWFNIISRLKKLKYTYKQILSKEFKRNNLRWVKGRKLEEFSVKN